MKLPIFGGGGVGVVMVAQVVTHSPPTFEVGGSNPGPYVEKLVAAY